MNPAAYVEMAETEARHWWFSGRRTILSRMIESLDLPRNSRILEVGCGTGGNLEMLARYGDVSAFEMDADARAIASRKTNNHYDIRAGHCPDQIPFHDQRFNLICMFDVLEHIEQDTEALIAVKQLLAKNGRILMTVPAYQWLWGRHDEFLHHRRRYSRKGLRRKLEDAGLHPTKISYFNTFLFPVAAIGRLKDRIFRSSNVAGSKIPPDLLNSILRNIFSAEQFVLKKINLPFGVSILGVLEVK